MKAPFFITGLPRSRTAWLANLFTTGGQFCHHDLLGKVENFKEFVAKLADGRGDSDSGLLFLWPQMTKLSPDSRWLLIVREADECVASFDAAAAGNANWESVSREMHASESAWRAEYGKIMVQMVRDHRVHVLRFCDLDNYDALAAAWKFLRPGTELSRERFDLLNPMLIEPIPAKTPLRVSETLRKEINELCQ